MGYRFSVEKFKENFNAKDITDKSIDSVRITHRQDGNFQVFPFPDRIVNVLSNDPVCKIRLIKLINSA